jgi:hypothetical protein
MMVIADNGIWQIVGTSTGFAADSYSVVKVSSFGCISASSVVEVENTAFLWSTGGIYTFVQDTSAASLSAGTYAMQPVTDSSIQTFYSQIPVDGKRYASGKYHPEERVVYWAYNSVQGASSSTDRFKKDTVLCFDIRLKAFYTLTISNLAGNTPFICDLFVTKGRSDFTATYNVVDNVDQQVLEEAAGDDVVVTLASQQGRNRTLKFLACFPQSGGTTFKFTFCDFITEEDAPLKWRDWYSVDSTGVGYDTYLITGFDDGGSGGDKFMQSLYITTYMKRTETTFDSGGGLKNESSCTMQGRWDWADNANSNRWSAEEECYRHARPYLLGSTPAPYEDGVPLVVTKHKVRGRGKAIHLKFTADLDKDMQLVGWAATYVGNGSV